MSKSLFSSAWYRVADLKPRLRGHAQIHRMRFRRQVWFILQDHQSGRFHRISPAAHLMISLMNGQRDMREIWELVGRRYDDHQPTQDETIQLLAQLHRTDLLHGEIPPDMSELSHRSDTQKKRDLMVRIKNPLALRFPLFDPDAFLQATMPLVRPVFSTFGFLLWCALAAYGAMLAALHWPDLTSNISDRVLAAENFLLLVLVYPVIKALHELGHAYATKRWGGEVHEIGLMLLVLIPVPYVDASASSAFREKWRRALVGGAGIMVEMALAAAAMIVWVNIEPGIVRAIAFNVMLIGGVSTLLFNGNPLLRFDGYYVFCDVIEIPNLGTRANRYIFYLIERYLLGLKDADSPVTAPGERGWFVVYGLAAFVYRLFIVFVIALFVAETLPVVGVLLAFWALGIMFVVPLYKGLRHLTTAPALHGRRHKAYAVVGGGVAAICVVLLALPLPHATVAEGVVWTPEDAVIRAGADGFLTEFAGSPNQTVDAGQPLIILEDPTLRPAIARLEAYVTELMLRLDVMKVVDRVQADMLSEQLRHANADLERSRRNQHDLTVRSRRAGVFVVPNAADLPGKFVRKGDLVGYVWDGTDPVIRVIIPQTEIDLVRQDTRRVDVRFANRAERVLSARILREAPAAVDDLPSMALSTQGGGAIALDPTAGHQGRALQSLFQIDIGVEPAGEQQAIGSRVHVKFDHGTEPIAFRIARVVRQLFLSRFDV